jgi:hypothetical protein
MERSDKTDFLLSPENLRGEVVPPLEQYIPSGKQSLCVADERLRMTLGGVVSRPRDAGKSHKKFSGTAISPLSDPLAFC